MNFKGSISIEMELLHKAKYRRIFIGDSITVHRICTKAAWQADIEGIFGNGLIPIFLILTNSLMRIDLL